MPAQLHLARLLGGVLLALVAANGALAQNGTLKLQFVYDGNPPVIPAGAVLPPAAACGANVFLAPIVDPKSKGVENVVVWLEPGNVPLPANALVVPKIPVKVDNRNCMFVPHVAIVQTNQPLVLTNGDPGPHNVKGDPRACQPFNVLLAPAGVHNMTICAAQNLPVPINCGIHPLMQGFLVVQDHPFVAVSDANGQITIPNLPVGNWTFVAWHESRGFVKAPIVNGKAEVWKRGRFTVNIVAGVNNQGTAAWAFAE